MSNISFTIATVCYNAAETIERTLHSVGAQDYPFVEHLIIDGASKDATLNHLHLWEKQQEAMPTSHKLVVVSEPDKGLYDAMNKALRLATGDYVLFLNAGDCFHSPTTLSDIVRSIQSAQYPDSQLPAVLYGDTDLVDNDGQFLRHRRLSPPEQLRWQDFQQGMLVCHQAFFVRTDLGREINYDLSYRFSADYDWCLRIMQRAETLALPLHNTHLVVADYLAEGMTTRNHRASLLERFHIMKRHFGTTKTIAQHAWFVARTLLKR